MFLGRVAITCGNVRCTDEGIEIMHTPTTSTITRTFDGDSLTIYRGACSCGWESNTGYANPADALDAWRENNAYRDACLHANDPANAVAA